MSRSVLAAAALAVALLAAPRAALAEINAADSIEWMTADSDLVVRGTVAHITRRAGPGQVTWFRTTIKVAETLKGPRQRAVELAIRHLDGSSPDAWRSDGRERLFFLVDSSRRAGDDPDYTAAPWALRRGDASAIDLGTTRVYDMAFDVLTRRADVLAAVRAAAGSSASRSHRIDVPHDAPAFNALYGGSSVWLIVPIDRRLEQLAHGWLTAKDLLRREEAIGALAHFRSRANVRRLEPLLADPDYAVVTPASGAPVRRYLARAAAHDVLSSWSVPHATPVIEEPHAPASP